MLPPIIVDLGPNVGQSELQLVLDACNEVIQNGVCLPDSVAHGEVPRATAIARPEDAAVMAVRIEVRLRIVTRTSWLVRELRFDAQDPTAERWRSVGLAIATLVGEGERQQALAAAPESGAPEDHAPESASSEANAPQVVPASPSPLALPPAEGVPRDLAPSLEPSPLWDGPAWAGAFFGIGVLAGPGFDDGSGRLGANARAGFRSASGWQWSASGAYSSSVSEQSFEANWLSLQAGVGYRLELSEQLSAALTVHGGVQRLRIEPLAGAEPRSAPFYNPLVSLGVDGWWRPTRGFGFWAAANAETIVRESHVFVAPGEAAVSSYPVDVSGVLGLGWWLP